jgi:hypothetical protein
VICTFLMEGFSNFDTKQSFILFFLIFYFLDMPVGKQVAVSFAACIYFLKDRTKKLGRSFIIGFGVMVLGWVSGSFVVPLLPTQLVPQSWSIELNTSLFSYVCLWAACTFLK